MAVGAEAAGGREKRGPARGPLQLPVRAWLGTLRRTGKEALDDHLLQWSAALTFFSVLSLFPAMLALVALLGGTDGLWAALVRCSLLLGETGRTEGWATGTTRATADPALDAWASTVLGPATRIAARIRRVDGDGVALVAAWADDGPLVRCPPVGAPRRLGRDDRVAVVADDPDPLVRAELAADVPGRVGGLDARATGRDDDGRIAGVIVDVGGR